jgi:hypothetical protein
MGRTRKLAADQVVEVLTDVPRHATVVGYTMTGNYRIVQTDAMGRNPAGPVRFFKAYQLEPTGKKAKTAGRIVRANLRAGGDEARGCACQCCAHVRGFEDE